MKQFLKSAAFLSLLTPVLLLADHVEVGTRPMSPDDRPEGEVVQADEMEGRNGFVFDRYPPVYYSACYHSLIAVSATGDQVELEDGSVWKINSYDGYKALNWRTTDPLTITQNHRWFSSYTYKIVNKNTGSSVEAKLFLGPVKDGEYTKYIYTLDKDRGEIYLTDTTHWEISSGDSYIFRDWAPNDSIIIGSNTGWDSKCESILINVTMNNFLRAKQF
ncbi:MAG TPA: hypothetical protein VLE89_06730 [Chlamydiales bacterium]|nr:hypothetical protein [Chlamydiales bacterium]